MEADCPYSPEAFEAKLTFVRQILRDRGCLSVLDVGCNTGTFSLMAADGGARVVAIDHDPAAIDHLWKSARDRNAAVLPLVVNIVRPSPAVGWNNAEAPAFLERAQGKFDCVLMLGLVHHLGVVERIPMDRIFDLAASLTTNSLIIEFVGAEDPQFRKLARGRDELFRDWTAQRFESCARRHFTIHSQQPAGPARHLYCLKKESF
ncbi:MAG: class I SAM-dependent methyltransferase [Acidobacteria bacterium]|nr:class I SAM-dependent methyltransferase [Acidobacteriota bacterium]